MPAPQIKRLFRYFDRKLKSRPAVLVSVNEDDQFLRVSFMDAMCLPESLSIWRQGKSLGPGYSLEKDSKVSVGFAQLVSATDYEDALSHELGLCHDHILFELRCTLIQHRKKLNPNERALVDKYLVKWQEKCPENDQNA